MSTEFKHSLLCTLLLSLLVGGVEAGKGESRTKGDAKDIAAKNALYNHDRTRHDNLLNNQ